MPKKKDVEVINISEPQTTGNPAQRRKQILENAKEVIKKPYLNKDTGVMIFLTSKSYTHTFSNSGELQLNIAEHLPKLVENAVLTNVEEPTHGSEDTDKVYKFLAAVKGDEVKPVKLTVKEYRCKRAKFTAKY